MSMRSLLRTAATVLALVALFDPSWSIDRRAPLSVDVRTAHPSYASLATDVKARLAGLEDVKLDSEEAPRAIVVVGDDLDVEGVTTSVPVFVVLGSSGSNVRVRELTASAIAIPGWTMPVHATIEATGVAGMTSSIVLEHERVQLQELQHRWSRDKETFNARFDYVPPTPGTSVLRVVAKPLQAEATADDNHADMQVAVEDRKLRVLFFEPRPSWATIFVRRAIELNALFEVETLARSSRGIEARTSSAPRNLAAGALRPFDAVVVGAPEELRAADLDALNEFVRVRGGTMVLIPDRRPSGLYAKLLPARGFDEVLTEKPAALQGASPALRCSETVVLAAPAAGVDAIAALARQNSALPAIVAWPNGAGRTIFSGCLDAWRHRAESNAFAEFWTGHIARAAAEAPRRLEISVTPAASPPRGKIRVTARVRRTEFSFDTQRIELPSISARVTDPRGALMPLRLWPTSEPGAFDGSFEASAPGRHVVEVSLGSSYVATNIVSISDGVRNPESGVTQSLRALAAASGGVVLTPDDLSLLEHQLGGIARAVTSATVQPSRSPLWALAFIVLLSAEWWLRRRVGRV